MFGRSADCTDDRQNATAHSIQMTQRIRTPNPNQRDCSLQNRNFHLHLTYRMSFRPAFVTPTARYSSDVCGMVLNPRANHIVVPLVAAGATAASPYDLSAELYPNIFTPARIPAGTSPKVAGSRGSSDVTFYTPGFSGHLGFSSDRNSLCHPMPGSVSSGNGRVRRRNLPWDRTGLVGS